MVFIFVCISTAFLGTEYTKIFTVLLIVIGAFLICYLVTSCQLLGDNSIVRLVNERELNIQGLKGLPIYIKLGMSKVHDKLSFA